MASMYSTGPALLWVGPQTIKPTFYTPLYTSPIRFLGTAEVSPQAEVRRQFQPAYNDLSGAVPFDLNFLGSDAILAVDLTRWNENVYALLASEPAQVTAAAVTRGAYPTMGPNSGMGALQAHDGNTVTVYLVFPYGFPGNLNNIPGVAFGMPAGYRFHGGSLINDKMHQMGSKYRKLHLTFQFAPIYNYASGVMTLYDNQIPSNLARPSTVATGQAA